MRSLVLALSLAPSIVFASPADSIEVGQNVRNSAVVDRATEFPAGTSVVALSRVRGAANQQVIHVWRRDGALFQIAHMPAKAEYKVTSSRVKVMPGTWTVDVHVGLGGVLARTTFVVR